MPEEKGTAIEKLLIPEAFKPAKVMRVQGKVLDATTGAAMDAQVKAYAVDTRERVWNHATNEKGEFAVVLKEGKT